jgi:hypothetical protein
MVKVDICKSADINPATWSCVAAVVAPESLLLPTGTCSLQSGPHLHPCAQVKVHHSVGCVRPHQHQLQAILNNSIFAVVQISAEVTWL